MSMMLKIPLENRIKMFQIPEKFYIINI